MHKKQERRKIYRNKSQVWWWLNFVTKCKSFHCFKFNKNGQRRKATRIWKIQKWINNVEIFNKHEINSFHLYQDALPTLKMLRSKNYKLGIITDGNIARQTRKILKFDLDKLVDNVTYTKNREAKPSPIPFVTALKAIDVEASSAIYVGDNPLVDFKGPKITGMKTARIVRGRFTHIPSDSQVDYTIEKMDEILKILSDL